MSNGSANYRSQHIFSYHTTWILGHVLAASLGEKAFENANVQGL